MFDLNKIQDNAIIITPNSIKKDILLETNKLDFDIKFMSKEELRDGLLFSYGDEAIAYLIEKNYSYANAKEILSNLYYLKDIEGSNKITLLNGIKEELINNKLLKYNPRFKYLLMNKNIYVYHYSKEDRELSYLLGNLSYEYLEDTEKNEQFDVYQYNNIEDEVFNMFNMICSLTKRTENPIELSQIKLLPYSSDYDLLVKKYASFYNLPINFKKEMSVYESPYFKEFLRIFDEYNEDESFLSDGETTSEFFLRVYEETLKIIEKSNKDNYNFFGALKLILIKTSGLFNGDRIKQREYIISLAKDKYLSLNPYENGIDIVDLNYVKDDYIFALGFNLLSYPTIHKDVEYLNDDIREKLGINTSNIENKMENEKLRSFLTTHNHVYLSYKKKIGKSEFYPSLLVDELKMNVIKNYENKTIYSTKALKNKVVKSKDLFDDYGMNDGYKDAIADEKKLDFKTFSNKFNTFEELKNLKDFDYSYTSIDTYYSCPFYFYLKYVLKLDEFEDRFNTILGSQLHKALERHVNEGLDFDSLRPSILSKFTTAEDLFFANKMLDKSNKTSNFNDSMLEGNSDLSASGEVEWSTKPFENDSNYPKEYENIVLGGSIDKMVESQKDKALIIVDYKSYSLKFLVDRVQYGLNMQLPIYLYLAKKNKPDYKEVGAYIQHILSDSDDINNIKLVGITLFDKKLLSIFEPALNIEGKGMYSTYFKGIQILKDTSDIRFKDRDNVISKEDLDEIISTAIDNVKKAIKKIKNGEFPVNPYRINSDEKTIGCSFCKHCSICFKEDKDYREIEIEKEKKTEDEDDE